MSVSMFLRTILEFFLFAALLCGCFNEQRLVAFERRIFCALKRRRLKVLNSKSFSATPEAGK